MTVASTSGLIQGYRNKKVITGLDLSISSGTLALLGPNGAGKSTLLRTLATVTPPLAGSVEIMGKRIDGERAARRARRQIGYLPQDFGYFPGYSVYDFVRYCAWLRGVPSKVTHRETLRVIDAVGLAKHSNAKLKSLSGGMLRRAGIATALVGSPRLVLLDEPTVGLDPAQRLEFRKVVRSLAVEGTAVVLSTHLVEDVAAVSDVIVVMRAGQLVFHGDATALARRGTPDDPGDSPLERGYMSVLTDQVGAAA